MKNHEVFQIALETLGKLLWFQKTKKPWPFSFPLVSVLFTSQATKIVLLEKIVAWVVQTKHSSALSESAEEHNLMLASAVLWDVTASTSVARSEASQHLCEHILLYFFLGL